MKNMMRRTVAFMLMACLLLSVMAPTAFAATDVTYDNAEIVYDFGTADESTIARGSWVAEIDGDNVTPTSVTKSGNAKFYAFYAKNNSTDGPKHKITGDNLLYRNRYTYYVALRLTGVTAGTYQYTMVTGDNNNPIDAYILDGDTTADEFATFAAAFSTAGALATQPSMTAYEADWTAWAFTSKSGEVTITEDQVRDSDNSIIVVFNSRGSKAKFNLNSLTMTPKIKLNANVDDTNISVTKGAILDLNGYTITGDVTVVNGQVIDSVGTGGVKGTLDVPGNKWLPLKDGDTYRFFEYTAKTNFVSGTDTDAYWFDAEFKNDAAYALLAANGTLSVTLEWSNAEAILGDKPVVVTGVVAGWANAERTSTDDYGMYVEVTKSTVPAEVGYIKVMPVFTTESGATIEFGTVVGTYAA